MTTWPGDIFLTRNIGVTEDYNESPGYFNHSAIYVGGNSVVEAQVNFGVILVNLDMFFERYPIIIRLKFNDEVASASASTFAKTLVGQPYRKIASIFKWLRLGGGENCVSVVRKAYNYGASKDPGWLKPDDIRADKRFTEIKEKFDNNFVVPTNFDELVRKSILRK